MPKNKLKYSKEGRELMKQMKMGYNAGSGANATVLPTSSETPVAKPPQVKKVVKKTLPTKAERRAKKAEKKAAKKAAIKARNIEKNNKKKVKGAPPPESESDSDDDVSDESDASGSESGPDEETKPQVAKAVEAKTNGVANADGGVKLNGKTNGAIKAAPIEDDNTSESSASSDDEDESAPSKPVSATVSKDIAPPKDESDDDSAEEEEEKEEESKDAKNSDSEDDDEDSDDEEEGVETKTPANAKALNGAVPKGKPVLPKVESDNADESEDESEDGSGDDESSNSSGDSADSSDSSEDDSDDEMEDEPPSNKRKAEDEVPPPVKKAKTEVAAAQNDGGKNLFVGSLSWNVDEDWLTREFESFGELSGVRIIMDRDSGRSKGYGYVEFVNAADAAKAHKEMTGAVIDNRPINVDFAVPRKESGANDYQNRSNDRAKSFGDEISPPSDTLFVGNLPFDANEDMVGQEFGNHATVIGVRMPTDPDTGRLKGYGYVQFGSIEDAQTAFDGMKGAAISGRPIRLDFGKPRDQSGGGGRGSGRGFGGGFGGGRGRGGFDRGGRGGGRGRGGFGDRGGRGGGRGGRGGSTNRGGFGDFQGKKVTF
ncbi:MAG: hypothetical protein MMC33_002327 [Icmadophila ericetorum]|nr:hypothetical protein [Icmadophila ericetorum]